MEQTRQGIRTLFARFMQARPHAPGHAYPLPPVALRESHRGNPPRGKNMSPVNSGSGGNSHAQSQFFRLANPLGLTDTWTHHGGVTDPVFPPFPPYLVF